MVPEALLIVTLWASEQVIDPEESWGDGVWRVMTPVSKDATRVLAPVSKGFTHFTYRKSLKSHDEAAGP